MKILKSTLYVLSFIQLIIFFFFFFFFKIIKKSLKQVNFIFGVTEIADNLNNLSLTFKNSLSVCFHRNYLYKSDNYDYYISKKNRFIKYVIIFFYGPFLLGLLMNKSLIFFYIWDKGFLLDRGFEFYILKQFKRKIILMYCGSEIRSPLLSINYTNSIGIDNFNNYLENNYFIDIKVKEEARLADKYADLIFSQKVDQISYIKKEVYDFPYMFSYSDFSFNTNKFDLKTPIVIVHAPSSPIIKGTQLVRAAIKKLKLLGYEFEYIELINKPNQEVKNVLERSHIVLNQFYGYGDGVGLLGVEAMANINCLMMSVSDNKSNIYKQSFHEVIFNTNYWNIDEKLKFLLENPSEIKRIAVAGHKFALKNFTHKAAKKYFDEYLKNLK